MGNLASFQVCACDPDEVEEPVSRVLVVGAGFGGLGCAHSLANSYDASSMKITLVDIKDFFSINATWQFVWTCRARMEQTKWPLAEAANELPGVDICTNTGVESFDLKARRATLKGGRVVGYDYLVLAPGSVSDTTKIPGLSEAAVDVANREHVEKAKEELEAFIAKATAKTADGDKPLLLVTIGAVPYKCPPLPFEVAGLLDHELRAAGVREDVRVALTCPIRFPLGGNPPNVASNVFLPLLEEKGIEWMPEHKLESVQRSGDKWKASFANGTELDADSVFATFPQRAPDVFVAAGLTNADGYIPVDFRTNRLQGLGALGADCFAVGDACLAPLPRTQQPHPKTGEFAWQMGMAVAENIRQAVAGGGDQLPSIRGTHCVVEMGGDKVLDIFNDLMPFILTPSEGKARISVSPAASKGDSHEKVQWINGYVKALYGSQRPFAPSA